MVYVCQVESSHSHSSRHSHPDWDGACLCHMVAARVCSLGSSGVPEEPVREI